MDWYKKQRLQGIETILYWHGRLNTTDITHAYGISRVQASKDIKQYITTYPGNMYYSKSEGAYLKASPFIFHLSKGSVDEYIGHISKMCEPNANMSIERLAPHYRQLNPNITSLVLHAIKDRKGIEIVYASMNNPQGNLRTIYPHSLVDTGFRWHVRAYCAKRKAFRDFNLGRIIDLPTLKSAGEGCTTVKYDKSWNTTVKVELKANPIFTENQQKLIHVEFGFKQSSYFVSTRACLVPYLLQRYQIDINQLEEPPLTQLLIVAQPKIILPFVF